MKSNPFTSEQTAPSTFANSGPWPLTGITLENMMWMFYHLRNFKVVLSATDLGVNEFQDGEAFAGAQTKSYAGAGFSQRRTANALDLLNQLDDAKKKTLVDNPNQDDVKKYQDLLKQSQTTAAMGEAKTFLRAVDINTSGIYPIFYFSGNLVSLRIDLGSVKKYGDLYFPACYCVIGPAGSSLLGLGLIGFVTTAGIGGLQIPIYNATGGNLGFGYGTLTPMEVYDDLILTPGSGQSGTKVKIAMPTDSSVADKTKQKTFSGFHSVKKVVYDGYDITDSFSFDSVDFGNDALTRKLIKNETCNLTIPQGARSSYFTFICEGKDDYGADIYDQFTLPQQFIVTS